MANPSTTGGSGAGTEVLRRTFITGANNTNTNLLTVPADHIYTILNITIVNNNDAMKACHIFVSPDGSGTHYIIKSEPIPNETSFIWNDKFVVTAGDIVKIWCSSTVTDVWCSYIDQQFA